jgi:hypothetical protein
MADENKSSTIERKLYYYDLSVYTKGSDEKIKMNQAGYLRKALKSIYASNHDIMECHDENEQRRKLDKMLYSTTNGDKIYVLVDNIEDEGPVELRIVLCRVDAFPFIEKNGTLSNMTSEVEGDFNVAEVTHCVVYPEQFIMGAEYNFSGARPSAIAKYIPMISNNIVSMGCHGKLRNDVFNRIIEGKGYSLFEIGVKNTPQMRIALRNHMGFIGAFIGNIDDVDSYEVSIKRRITKKKKGFEPPITARQLEEFVNQNREDINHFKISQGVYKDSIDLLSDKLVHCQEFILTNNKVIDSTQVYNAIKVFYNEVVSG